MTVEGAGVESSGNGGDMMCSAGGSSSMKMFFLEDLGEEPGERETEGETFHARSRGCSFGSGSSVSDALRFLSSARKESDPVKRTFLVCPVCLFFLILGLTLFSPGSALAQIRLRFRPYIGVGAMGVLDSERPDFTPVDAQDSSYITLNLSSLQKVFFHAHTRLMLIDLWNFSLGYQFWSHSYTYPADLTEYWLKIGTHYPYSRYFSMHGPCVQYTFKHRFVPAAVRPFLLAGVGKYYGAEKTVYYDPPPEGSIYLVGHVEEDRKFEGWGYFLGIGVVLFKYAFVYAGYVDLYRRSLVSSQFVLINAGFTL